MLCWLIIEHDILSGGRLKDFTIYVGGVGDSTSTNYEVCAKMCGQQTNRKRVYWCKRELIGQRVAVQINRTESLTLCEVEVYGKSIQGAKHCILSLL